MNANFESIKPVEIPVTTPEATVDEPTISEDYENYEDFDEGYYGNIANLQEQVSNVLNITTSAAKIVTFALHPGDPPEHILTESTAISVEKNKGSAFVEKLIVGNNCAIIGSKDFINDSHLYDIFLIEHVKDLLWWNPNKIQVSTSLVNVNVWHAKCVDKVETFKNPMPLLCNITHGTTETIKDETINIPKDFLENYKEAFGDKMFLRRIALQGNLTLRVVFNKLEADDVLDMIFTINVRPKYDDFFKNQTITVTAENDIVLYPNLDDNAVWVYLAVMPNKKSVNKTKKYSYKFGISYQVEACIKWSDRKTAWVWICKSVPLTMRPRNHQIWCSCQSFSLVAGYLQNVPAIPQEVVQPEFILRLLANYTIFWFVFATILIYCILAVLCCIMKRTSGIYYLADNRRNDPFAYIIIINTGAAPSSGTTSNVTIKLIGDEGASHPHVLNYPDPEFRILQTNNEDTFIMTTETYLGNVTEICFWFDCIGFSPSWYIIDVVVYDVQSELRWYFYVDNRLALEPRFPKQSIIKCQTLDALKKKKKPWFENVEFFSYYHTWRLSNHRENYSYFKRLTILLCKLLLIYVFALLFIKLPEIYIPKFTIYDPFEENKRVHFAAELLGTAATAATCSFSICITLTILFRASKVQLSRVDKQDFPLPLCMTVFLWMILVLLICTSAIFLISVGYWVPYIRAKIWMLVVCLAVVIDIFILENFASIGLHMCYKIRVLDLGCKLGYVKATMADQRAQLYSIISHRNLLRPYFKHLYIPLTRLQIKRRMFLAVKKHSIRVELEDAIMFAVYIIILYLVILLERDWLTVYSRDGVLNLVDASYVRDTGFSSVGDVPSLIQYVNYTLIPSLLPIFWYGNYVVSDPGLMIDASNKILGVARLRQHRIKRNSCEEIVQEVQEFDEKIDLLEICVPEYGSRTRDAARYNPGWTKHSSVARNDRLKKIWRYTPMKQSGTFAYIGHITKYPGGGYIASLGRTLYNSRANYKVFSEKNWIDFRTRVVFIEFLTYSASSNIFNAIRLVLEISASGYSRTTIVVEPDRLIQVEGGSVGQSTAVLFLMFAIWITVLFCKQSLSLIKSIKSLYKNAWFYVDGLIIALSVACISLKLYREDILEDYLQHLKDARHNEFVSYFELFHFSFVMNLCAALLVCISTLRLWKLLRFGLLFRILETTLKDAILPLLPVLVFCFVIYLACGFFATIIFGREFNNFYDFGSTVRTVFLLTLRPAEINKWDYIQYSQYLAYPFFIIYFISVQLILFFFICTITDSYANAKMIFSSYDNSYTVKSYVIDQVKTLPLIFKFKLCRLRSGANKKIAVVPKADDFRYSGSLQTKINSLDCMMMVVKAHARKRFMTLKKLSNRDVEVMYLIAHHFVFKEHDEDDVSIFFSGHIRGDRLRFVSDEQIQQMEIVSNDLFERKQPEAQAKAQQKYPKVKKCVETIKRNQLKLFECDRKMAHLMDLEEQLETYMDKFKYLSVFYD